MPQNEVKIMLNGNPKTFPLGSNINTAVQFLIPNFQFVAVEYNGHILDKNDYTKTLLKNEDILEVVQPLGGGSR